MSTGDQITLVPEAHTPPAHCEYASGPCDQDFATALLSDAVFLYPTTPQTISSTIEAAVEELGKVQAAKKWTTWKDFGVTGQIIFCEICKAMRFTRLVVADVTTLNFNLLFEIGVAVGLGLPILPIRDTSFKRDQKTFDELGILDTLGYFDFQNSQELAAGVLARQDLPPLGLRAPALNTAQPLYVVKSPVENDGQVRLLSLMKRSGLKMRTFDPNETSRLSLHEAYKQVLCSRAVVLHSYQFEHNPSRMQANLRDFSYCVHPAFRRALGTQ